MIQDVNKSIEEFKVRIEKDGKDFCQELFERATVRLMAHKYAYYVCHNNFVSDYAYDFEEKSWYVMGRALGFLKEDETSPCVDYDPKHPYAEEGRKLAERLMRK